MNYYLRSIYPGYKLLLCPHLKAEIAAFLVRRRVPQERIAALTPYSAQKEEIKRYLSRERLSDIQVKTVTESQGI